MHYLKDEQRDYIFNLSDAETASDVLPELDDVSRADIIEDLDEKRLKRELDILKGRRGELTDEEKKKDRIRDIETRLKRLQEDRLKSQEDHTRAVEAANEELGKLDKQAKDIDKKFKEATSNVSLLEQSLKQSSDGALKFTKA